MCSISKCLNGFENMYYSVVFCVVGTLTCKFPLNNFKQIHCFRERESKRILGQTYFSRNTYNTQILRKPS